MYIGNKCKTKIMKTKLKYKKKIFIWLDVTDHSTKADGHFGCVYTQQETTP